MTAYHDRLPYGERLSAEPVRDNPFLPFDGELRVRPLADPVIPEPPRFGEPGGNPCRRCADPDNHVIWRDEQWSVSAGFEPIGLPMLAVLEPIEHVTLHTMGPDLTVTLGSMIQRVAVAVGRIEGVGRTHFSRFGDGGEHFHVWFLARPLGMMQMRGPMLAVWDDLLPRVPDEELHENMRTVATVLAEDGGTQLIR